MRRQSESLVYRGGLLFAFAVVCVPAGAQSSLLKWQREREAMVQSRVADAGVTDSRVLQAMLDTPRHEFVPLPQRRLAYKDMALPIGSQQTISPPFVVAYMTEQLDPQPSDRVLEIGTGSGYQAAVLSPLVKEVYTIEIVEELGRRAARALRRGDYENVSCRIGDGYLGWPEVAPFDKIIVTCSPEKPPQPLVDQLAEGGQMIIPVGERYQQNLYRLTKRDGRLEREALRATLFVPMTGEAEAGREKLPNARNPRLVNGDFARAANDATEKRPAGWHYLRQAEHAAEGRRGPADQCLRFTNEEPGLGSQALQGFAIDGRRVKRLRVSFAARGEAIRPGRKPGEWPHVAVTFYDERRGHLATELIGPLRGAFDWTEITESIATPVKAREAIIRIGLLGATGRLWIDDVEVARAERDRG